MTTAVPVLFCNGCLVVKLCRWDTRVTENSGEQCPWDWPHLTRAEITHSTLIGERQPIDLGTFDVGSLFIYKKESHVKNLDFKCSQKPGRFHKARGPHFFMHAVGWSQVSFLQKGHESPVHHSPHHSISSVTAYWLPLSFVLSVTSMLAFEGCGFVCVCVCVFACLFVFVFWPGSSQDLSSQARDRNCAPWSESWSPNHWITGEVPDIWVLTSDLDAETLDLLWKNRERKKKAKSRMRKQRSWSQIIVRYQEPWTWVKRTQILLWVKFDMSLPHIWKPPFLQLLNKDSKWVWVYFWMRW